MTNSKFVRLHRITGTEVFFVRDMIVSAETVAEFGATVLTLVGSEKATLVRETPETIAALLDGEKS